MLHFGYFLLTVLPSHCSVFCYVQFAVKITNSEIVIFLFNNVHLIFYICSNYMLKLYIINIFPLFLYFLEHSNQIYFKELVCQLQYLDYLLVYPLVSILYLRVWPYILSLHMFSNFLLNATHLGKKIVDASNYFIYHKRGFPFPLLNS